MLEIILIDSSMGRMAKSKKRLTQHLHHRAKHHVRQLRKRWKTPHTVIAVIVFLAVSFGILSYQQITNPTEGNTQANTVYRSSSPDNEAIASPSASDEFAVALGKASVDHDAVTGCSATYNFLYPVTSNKAGSITFQRMRSDGTVIDTQPQTLYFSKAETKSITYAWEVDKTYEFSGYSYVQILSPKPATSNYANIKFTYFCQ